MNTETKHTPDELITCPACGNEYQYQDSPQCFESAEAAAKELAQLKADKVELVDALKLSLATLQRVYVKKPGGFSSIAGTEAISEHLIAKHSKP